jgi:Rrf2 family protein
MEISKRTDYGVRVILDLAALPPDQRASTQQIADRQDVPSPFLAKIISQLSVAGLVVTYRGATGGVALARPPAEITLLEVIEALDGPIRVNRCVTQPESCSLNGRCPVRDIWVKAQAELKARLGLTTFEQLARTALKLGQDHAGN